MLRAAMKATDPPVLRRMTAPEYEVWLAEAIPGYAADKVQSGRWTQEESLERAREEYAQLLPHGVETADNHLYTVLDESGAAVGSIWFAEASRVGYKVAYVFDVVILPGQRRRGHARRAFAAVERVAAKLGLAGVALHVFGHNTAARALYAELGYQPTNINLYKPLR
jgi:ribosomal protein S18 acetylase RimI-like enzyme